MITIDSGKCTGCGACVERCPEGAIRLVDGLAGIDQAKCKGCEACVEVCPENAILPVNVQEIEGELVPVEVKKVTVEPQRQRALVPRKGLAVLPWLGAALTFVAREIVPRLADAALDAWDRRSALTASSTSDVASTSSRPPPVLSEPRTDAERGAGRQRRFRRRGGR